MHQARAPSSGSLMGTQLLFLLPFSLRRKCKVNVTDRYRSTRPSGTPTSDPPPCQRRSQTPTEGGQAEGLTPRSPSCHHKRTLGASLSLYPFLVLSKTTRTPE